MIDVESILKRYKELEEKVIELSSKGDIEELKKILPEYNTLKSVITLVEEYRNNLQLLEEMKALMEVEKDRETLKQLQKEVESIQQQLPELERKISQALVPKDPKDEKNAIMEIRAGAGGEEAALFAADLFRMYVKYAESKGWKVSVLYEHPTDLGGYKEIHFIVQGKGAYGRLKFEGGVHRVQRIPITETGGRIHTSTASVVVLPEYEDTSDIEIREEELKIETMRASGAGGQHVNKTESAVRITHIPTGIVVHVQDERSQHQNKAKALRILKSRLKELKEREKREKIGKERKSMIGTMERSEKIRTYNFPQNRVTDHRLSGDEKNYPLERIMEGELDELIDNLMKAELELA